MLSARRDPTFDPGTHEASPAPQAVHPGHAGSLAALRPSGFARFIAGLQILGTVLGIPLGLASGYSIYRANFSPEANCGSLRGNIISMLDKNADATTLRLLVRRDVASFEKSCAAVDPDAVAAFKTLLAKPQAVAAAAKELKPVQAKKPVAHATPVERAAHASYVEPERRVAEKPTSTVVDRREVRANADADWLAAVRRALVEHAPVVRAQAAEAPVSLRPQAAHPMGQLMPAEAHGAPPLPPATAVANSPAPHSDDDHPVPPAPIPNVGPGPAH